METSVQNQIEEVIERLKDKIHVSYINEFYVYNNGHHLKVNNISILGLCFTKEDSINRLKSIAEREGFLCFRNTKDGDKVFKGRKFPGEDKWTFFDFWK